MLDDLIKKRPEIEVLCDQYSVATLSVFGSAATGNFDQATSDIDLLVEFSGELTASQTADSFFGLKADLETLFGRPVDLITRRSLTNPYFKESALAEAQALYAA